MEIVDQMHNISVDIDVIVSSIVDHKILVYIDLIVSPLSNSLSVHMLKKVNTANSAHSSPVCTIAAVNQKKHP